MIRRLFLTLGLKLVFGLTVLGIGSAQAQLLEPTHVQGTYYVECYAPDGTLRWKDEIHNVVTTVGKNLALDTYLTGSGYTVTGPFLGLITNTSFSNVAVGDTMSSHAGWLEAGGANQPTYVAPRKTPTWSAAAGGIKQFSAAVQFVMTGTGTLRGAFLVYGTGASSTIDDAGGTLYSAGTFNNTYGVSGGDLVKVSYATAM